MALNLKRLEFARYFVANGRNGTKAAESAGYSAKTAYSQANRLLKNVEVIAEIDRLAGDLLKRKSLDIAEVQLELRRILLADPADALDDDGKVKPLRQWPKDLRRALGSVKFKRNGELVDYRFWSKTAASDQLARQLGAYKDTVTVKGLGELLDAVAARKASK